MNEDNQKETLRSRLKDIDRVRISFLLKIYYTCFSAFGTIFYFMIGLTGYLIAAVISVPLALLVESVTDKISHGWGKLFYGGRKPRWTKQEQLQGDIRQVMFLKRQKQFPQALKKVNEILKKEPKFAEALFLKAQILWEGYETANGARRYLNIAKGFAPPKEYLYRWICSYYDGISGNVANKNN